MSNRDHAPSRSALEQAIEAERRQLLQAHAVLKCLYEVLLHADSEDAVTHAQAVQVAAKLIEDALGRLDLVRLRPMIEAMKQDAPLHKIEEPTVVYLPPARRPRNPARGRTATDESPPS